MFVCLKIENLNNKSYTTLNLLSSAKFIVSFLPAAFVRFSILLWQLDAVVFYVDHINKLAMKAKKIELAL